MKRTTYILIVLVILGALVPVIAMAIAGCNGEPYDQWFEKEYGGKGIAVYEETEEYTDGQEIDDTEDIEDTDDEGESYGRVSKSTVGSTVIFSDMTTAVESVGTIIEIKGDTIVIVKN